MFKAILAMSLGMLLASNVQSAEARNPGQAVSHCNHLANAKKVKGQARKEFIDLCNARAMGGSGQSGRYQSCSERAHERGLSSSWPLSPTAPVVS